MSGVGSIGCTSQPELAIGTAPWLQTTFKMELKWSLRRAIQKNQDLLPETPWQNIFQNDFWGTPLTHSGSHKSYRPLCVLSFRLNYLLAELNPFVYHLTNIILHAVVVGLFTSLSEFLLKSKTLAVLAGLVFATHPIHTEAVAGVVGRAEIGAGLFFLLSFMTYIRYCQCRSLSILQVDDPISRQQYSVKSWMYLFLSLLCASASMLWKEQAITVLAINAVYDVFICNKIQPLSVFQILYKRKYRPVCLGVLVTGLWGVAVLACRISIMGSVPPEFSPSDNPASNSSSTLTRSLTYHFLPAFNIWLLLNPYLLSFDWSMEAIPLLESISDVRNLATLLLYFSLLLFGICSLKGLSRSNNGDLNSNNTVTSTSNGKLNSTYQKLQKPKVLVERFEIIILSLAIMIVPFIPATNLFFYVGFVVAERVLYIPSMGYSLLLVYGVHILCCRVNKTKHKYFYLIMSVLLILFSVRTFLRNQDWQTEEALYRSGIATNPPKAWGNLANILKSQGKVEEAEMAYKKALEYRGNMADAHYNLGILLQESNRNEEALESYKNAIRYRPRLAMAHLNLGMTLANVGRQEEAKVVYRHAATMDDIGLKDPKSQNKAIISAIYNLGRLYHDEGNYQEASTIFQEAIDRCPEYYSPQSLYNMMGDCLSKLGQYEAAETWFQKALSVKADHVPAYLTYAHLLDTTGRNEEAERMLNKALSLEPNSSSVYQHYGQHYAQNEKYSVAASMYQKAVELNGDDFDIVFNAANAHRQAGLKEKAEVYYWKAVLLKPQEPSAHLNLGAMLHVNGKLREAELQYMKALKLKPDDEITKSNLKKVRTLINKSK
ncbi:protein O-mannosyl-transferase TMTC2-like [Glandiceps talaboti]